jgi:hypothetical protein
MDVYIELLRGGTEVRALLREHGWRLDEQGAGRLLSKHEEVSDQEVARDWLLRVGLLTSAEVRIEFGRPARDSRSVGIEKALSEAKLPALRARASAFPHIPER